MRKESLFEILCTSVNTIPPGSRLSLKLQKKFQELPKSDRAHIVNQTERGCSPLFTAARRGLAEVVEYLHVVCDADLEQKGMYNVPDDRSIHYVTPLWCASVADKLETVKILIKLGADINNVSDTGSTPVRSACFMTNFEVVKFLVLNGADVQAANYNGGTCLINSVQNDKLCAFLIKYGAEVDACDVKGKTALHYAIEEQRFETVKLLLDNGSDPFLKNKRNDDALQIACSKGAFRIFTYLMETLKLSMERQADAHELLGATYLDDLSDIHEAMHQWRSSILLRKTSHISKKVAPPKRAFNFITEFTNQSELDEVFLDVDLMKMHSLLITERILGIDHKDTIYRIMFRGAAYADAAQYGRCWQLWFYVWQLRVEMDTILFTEACSTAQALIRLFMDLFEQFPSAQVKNHISFPDTFLAIQSIGDELLSSRELLEIKPVYNKQKFNYDIMVTVLLYFLHFALSLEPTEDQLSNLCQYVYKLLKRDLRTQDHGHTLLHMSVINTVIQSGKNDGFNFKSFTPFPNFELVKFFLECGANINSTNITGASPLYLATSPRHYNKQIFDLLISRGAHIDQATNQGDTVYDIVKNYRNSPHVEPMNNCIGDISLPVHSLKCLSAKVLKRNDISIDILSIPEELEKFVRIH